MMKAGVYGKYQDFSPKHDWNFGDSVYFKKKDFSDKKANYRLYG